MPFTVSGGHRIYYEVIDIVEPWRSDPATMLQHHGIGPTAASGRTGSPPSLGNTGSFASMCGASGSRKFVTPYFMVICATIQLSEGLPNPELNVFGHAKHGLPFSHAPRTCGGT